MSETLDARRLALMLRADAYGWYRTLLVVSAALAGLIFLGALFVKRGTDGATVEWLAESYYFGWFAVTLFVWGFIASSRAFSDLHDKTRNTAFLLLPASSLEKTLARLLLVTIAFVAFVVGFIMLVSWLAEGTNALLSGGRDPAFRPLEPRVWNLAAHYVVLQSLFFLGAAWFRKNHFFKTALALIVIVLVAGAFGVLLNRILLGPYLGAEEVQLLLDRMSYDFYLAHRGLLDTVATVGGLIYFVALPLYCWMVAWLRVKETQVSHGV